jgi:tRNA dimethylallyltransferase
MSLRLNYIVGCTASGKSSLGVELARRLGGEIIAIDSMKVYRGMDIGTAKPSAKVREVVPHHLIDVVDPWEEFSVAQYVALADKAIEDIHARGRKIFVVGGTPLYIKALSEGLFEGPGADPQTRDRLQTVAQQEGTSALHERLQQADPVAAGRIHRNDLRRLVRALEVFELTGKPISALQEQWDRERPRYDCQYLGLRWSKEDLHLRIKERVLRMMDKGLIDEVKSLLALDRPLSTAARQAVGYAEVIDHLQGGSDLAHTVEAIKINTRQLAKAQRTWFKRFRAIVWIDLTADAEVNKVADSLMERLA